MRARPEGSMIVIPRRLVISSALGIGCGTRLRKTPTLCRNSAIKALRRAISSLLATREAAIKLQREYILKTYQCASTEELKGLFTKGMAEHLFGREYWRNARRQEITVGSSSRNGYIGVGSRVGPSIMQILLCMYWNGESL